MILSELAIFFKVDRATTGGIIQFSLMPEKSRPTPLKDVEWLGDVHEMLHPLSQAHPLFVRVVNVMKGVIPAPSEPFPERHPYCEMNFTIEGDPVQFIGSEQVVRRPGDVMLLAPGTPHYAVRHSYPHRGITIYLLPMLLLELGPEGDGCEILSRFTTEQPIGDRVIRPPHDLSKRLGKQFEQMAAESKSRGFGWEFRLRSLLMDSLVALMRWEKSSGKRPAAASDHIQWDVIENALRYIRENFAEQIYVQNIADFVGMNRTFLQATFRQGIGMSCMQYLRAFRVSQAKAALAQPNARVTVVAYAVGFDTLSNFNVSFRSLIGMSPREYLRSIRRK